MRTGNFRVFNCEPAESRPVLAALNKYTEGIMQSFLRYLLICATAVLSLHAEAPNPANKAISPATKETAISRPKPKRFKWLRRLGSAEVNLAMKLSAVGIER